MSTLFLSPHNDDETLFGAFTIMKEKPIVCVVFDSYVQVARGNAGATASRRRNETVCALGELGYVGVEFAGLRDDAGTAHSFNEVFAYLKELKQCQSFDHVIFPAYEEFGHLQHNVVGTVARQVFAGVNHTQYLTYTRTGGRSRGGVEVIPTSEMIARKHRALACYESQMEVENCRDWFLGDLREYVLPPAGSDATGQDIGGVRL